MYMAVRYEGGKHGVTDKDEPDLILTDDRGLMDASQTGSNVSIGYMGLKSVLLQWHKDDPVDLNEVKRNDVVHGYQGNRNPFIDHPEYIECVFENDCSALNAGNSSVWVNEFHYDNTGSDTGEEVEIAGLAGTDLSGWQIVAYNGNGGVVYKTVNLSGTIPNQQNGLGTVSFQISGLQNGKDGFALVNSEGVVVQFLS